MNVLFYCQHSLGLGHFMRTMRIAEGISQHAQVSVITGGVLKDSLLQIPQVKIMPLTPLAMNVEGKLIDPAGKTSVEDIQRQRVIAINNYAKQASPDVVVVEMYPFGRKKYREEITELLNICRQQKNIRVICSVRDILVSRGEEQATFDRRALEVLNEQFDSLLIHADPALISFERTFSLFEKIQIPYYYTGYVANNRPNLENIFPTADAHEREARAVVSSGGGMVGKKLLEVAINSATKLYRDYDLETLVLCGALTENLSRQRNYPSFLKIRPFSQNFASLIAQSRVSINQCGYNTATDIMMTQTPSVFVPFETAKEDEQLRRASCLEANEVGICLREKDLTANTLVHAVGMALSSRALDVKVNTDGVENSCAHILRGDSRAVA